AEAVRRVGGVLYDMDDDQPPASVTSTAPSVITEQVHRDNLELRKELNELKKENKCLKKISERQFGFLSLRNSSSLFKFFTGLQTVQIFMWLLNVLKPNVVKVKSSLSLKDHLLIILMKLRLGLTNQDLAVRFDIPKCLVSRLLRRWLPVMGKILKDLIIWPSKEAVRKNMPRIFKKSFRKCRCIIDCSEFFIERPSNLTARAQTWSNYKHHNTLKYLIGITPAGAISFFIRRLGGRVSDKQITVESNFLDKIEPRTILKIPSFTKGKKQLPGTDVDHSQELARVHIHVERVIGRLRKYQILQTVIPLSLVDLADNIVIACAALVNLSPSVVPKKKK
uniref:DDE Tnp4 domain-containing protein n=1 Tax=Sphaeramia orbicularis TaxID=375764 RepID=A0A672ZSJ7_9TELE